MKRYTYTLYSGRQTYAIRDNGRITNVTVQGIWAAKELCKELNKAVGG
jgi:hypothetical protein